MSNIADFTRTASASANQILNFVSGARSMSDERRSLSMQGNFVLPTENPDFVTGARIGEPCARGFLDNANSERRDIYPGERRYPVGMDTWNYSCAYCIPVYTASGTSSVQVLYNANAWWNVYTGKWKRSGNSSRVEAQILASSSNNFHFIITSISGMLFPPPRRQHRVLPSATAGAKNPAKWRGGAGVSRCRDDARQRSPDGRLTVAQPNGSVFEAYAAIALSTGQVVCLSYTFSNPNSRGRLCERSDRVDDPRLCRLLWDNEVSAARLIMRWRLASLLPCSRRRSRILPMRSTGAR